MGENVTQLDLEELLKPTYKDKVYHCRKAWIKGAIFGALIGIAFAFLIAGFEIGAVFFVMLPFSVISSVMLMAAVFGMNYLSGSGISCIPWGLFSFGQGIIDFFSGTTVTMLFALVLFCLVMSFWVFAFVLYAFLFPLETVYYCIRYAFEKKAK